MDCGRLQKIVICFCVIIQQQITFFCNLPQSINQISDGIVHTYAVDGKHIVEWNCHKCWWAPLVSTMGLGKPMGSWVWVLEGVGSLHSSFFISPFTMFHPLSYCSTSLSLLALHILPMISSPLCSQCISESPDSSSLLSPHLKHFKHWYYPHNIKIFILTQYDSSLPLDDSAFVLTVHWIYSWPNEASV